MGGERKFVLLTPVGTPIIFMGPFITLRSVIALSFPMLLHRTLAFKSSGVEYFSKIRLLSHLRGIGVGDLVSA